MRKNLIALFFLLITTNCLATVVFFNKNTKEAMFITENENAIFLSKEDQNATNKLIIRDKVLLDNPISDYIVVNNQLILNTKKITEKENTKSSDDKIVEEKKAITLKAWKMACDKLVEEGKKFTKINCNEIE